MRYADSMSNKIQSAGNEIIGWRIQVLFVSTKSSDKVELIICSTVF